MTTTLQQQQEALEREATDLGIAQYRKRLERLGDADTRPGVRLIENYVEELALAIEGWRDRTAAGRANRHPSALPMVQAWVPEALAYVTLRALIQTFGTKTRPALTAVSNTIGSRIESALTFDGWKKEAPGLYRHLQRKLATKTDEYQVLIVRGLSGKLQIKSVKWRLGDRIRLGLLLIELATQVAGEMFSIEQVRTGRRTRAIIVPTEKLVEWLRAAHAHGERIVPAALPMVCPPKAWEGLKAGGYYTSNITRLRLIKGPKKYEEPSQNAYDAINAVQATGWRINTGVLDVLAKAWELDNAIAGLPQREPVPVPAKTFDKETPSDDPRVTEWRIKSQEVHDTNARTLSQRIGVGMTVSMATRFAAYDAIYFPWQYDFRGRMYPVAAFLHPQGDDAQRSLLTFAEAKTLGPNGAFWLAVHLANSAGVDKVPFAERVAWVEENYSRILSVGNDPLGEGLEFWKTTWTEKPWAFLAAAQEWVRLDRHVANGGTQDEFMSSLPVSLDGSCNGLQNFAAMLRDEESAAAVNVTPNDRPTDVYRMVADEAVKIMTAQDSEMSKRWLPIMAGKLGRKLTKRNTMTVPYAVTAYGMRGQLRSLLAEIADQLPFEADFDDAKYLASVNAAAIGIVVKAASRAMTFLQACAKAASEATEKGAPIMWTTPVGFVVKQAYESYADSRLKVTMFGRQAQLTLREPTGELNAREQLAGVAPNFVHSMDAAHLTATVDFCLRDGVTSFAMVHDSFGTHAGQVDKLASALREAFVWLYADRDVLAEFRDGLLAQLPEGTVLPPLPQKGTLDVASVKSSEYFFA